MPFHSGYGYYGTGDWLWSIFSTALFIVLVTLAIMLLVRVFSGPRQGPGVASRGRGPWFGPGPGASGVTRPGWGAPVTPEAAGAERILAERYARGEISEEQYRSRLEVLRQAAAGWAQPGPPRQQPAEPPVPASAGQDVPTEEVR
ncbi:SHOCT domain-containing protein [Actinospica sp.]|jgi:putative membrane protein|uniref:SHOCT domain-containing protein n=1 Tax=Actinospica sp. TaxID=1872142 RepID=UPI002BA4BE39|nr:SHOCT domain-containing protein [Actinospica sp.]HWG25468.1 SHOCT domain-containing protein [Actinospica sp.]